MVWFHYLKMNVQFSDRLIKRRKTKSFDSFNDKIDLLRFLKLQIRFSKSTYVIVKRIYQFIIHVISHLSISRLCIRHFSFFYRPLQIWRVWVKHYILVWKHPLYYDAVDIVLTLKCSSILHEFNLNSVCSVAQTLTLSTGVTQYANWK